METAKILDLLLPYTYQDHRCNIDKQIKTYRREKLRQAIDDYRRGGHPDFRELHLLIGEGELLSLLK